MRGKRGIKSLGNLFENGRKLLRFRDLRPNSESPIISFLSNTYRFNFTYGGKCLSSQCFLIHIEDEI